MFTNAFGPERVPYMRVLCAPYRGPLPLHLAVLVFYVR